MMNKSFIRCVSSITVSIMILPSAMAKVEEGAKGTKKKTVGELLATANNKKAAASTNVPAKGSTTLPSASLGFKQERPPVNLEAVKPQRGPKIYSGQQNGSPRSEYEAVLDQQINELFKITKKFKDSSNRGDLWLRLAELYVEKAGLIDARKQDEYDAKLRAFQAGKSKNKPTLDIAESREYNKKAIQLYEWFQRDFPQDERMDQAYFFLGYNYFELGDVARGAKYYSELTAKHPKSNFVGEAHFALGEYYFENEKWHEAYKEYAQLLNDKQNRLYNYSLYKSSWCLFRIGKTQQSINGLEQLIKLSRAEGSEKAGAKKKTPTVRLEGEALRDIVVFYAEGGDPAKAASYFKNLVGSEASSYLERLAFQYSDRGNKDASRDIFKLLISFNPLSAKAFEYQYQIVQNYYYGKDVNRFKGELFTWIKDYGPGASWATANKENKQLIASTIQLRETTLRNYVLQQHQTAQNSRAAFSQSSAYEGYQIYLKEFPEAAAAGEMNFYFGELLYDMEKYDEAAAQYKWVVDKAPQNKLASKAAQNLLLSLERSIPSDQELQKRVGKSLDPIPLEPKVEKFIQTGRWYVEKFPQSEKTAEIKFRIGRLYYQSNHFEDAIVMFREIVKAHPKTKYAEYSANLLLDIYNLKKDYAGLEKIGEELLAAPAISSSKAGGDIKNVIEKAAFKKAQDLETEKKFAESAQMFADFEKVYPRSALAITAIFNSGINFEKAGMNTEAMVAYQKILNSADPAADKLKPQLKHLLAKQYQDSAQFEEAGKLYRQAALENPKSELAANWIFNAAVLHEALGKSEDAVKDYADFIRISKKHQENIDAVYSVAQIHRKAGQKNAAINRYIEYIDGGGRDQEKIVSAAYWISALYAEINSNAKANEWRNKTLLLQQKFANGKKGVGASYVAKIKLAEAEGTFLEMKSISFPKDPKKQKDAADRKINLLNRLTTELGEVIKFDSADEIVSALNLLGEANENMAEAILKAPLPSGLNPEEQAQYKAGVARFAQPYKNTALESSKKAVERGFELEVYGKSFKDAFNYISQADPKNFYNGGELSSDLRLVDWMAGENAKSKDSKINGELSEAIKEQNDSKIFQISRKILSEQPTDMKALNALALYYYKQNRYELSRMLFSRAIASNPKNSTLQNNLGVVQWGQGETRDAVKSFRKALQINGQDGNAAANAGLIYLQDKDYSKAVVALEIAYQSGIKDHRFLNNYAMALTAQGKFNQAEGLYKNILKENSNKSEYLFNYSVLLIDKMEKYQDGLDNINRLKFVGGPAEVRNRIIALENKAKAGLK